MRSLAKQRASSLRDYATLPALHWSGCHRAACAALESVLGSYIRGDHSMRNLLLAAAASIAATLAQAPAQAQLMFTPTSFDGQKAVIDETSGLGWVTPNIASSDNYSDLINLCPNYVCTGALAGLHWASAGQVSQFWTDVGIPMSFFNTYSGIGVDLLSSLINALGPTNSSTVPLIGTTDTLAGISNDSTNGPPITPYLFHFFSIFGTPLDNESAFAVGLGNGTNQNTPTGGWFYFTPASAVPESSTWAMMIIGFASLGFAAYRGKRNNRDAAFE
jgi:hypothetical protein